MTVEKLKLKSRAGANFKNIKPKFSLCEDFIYIARNNSILQYSTRTGLLFNEYHEDEAVVGFDILSLQSSETLITCFENGMISAWKTITHFKSFTKVIPCENLLTCDFFPGSNNGQIDVLEGIISFNKEGSVSVGLVNISKESLNNLHLNIKDNILIGVSRRRFIAVLDKMKIQFCYVDNPKKLNSVLFKNNNHKKVFTCVECHSTEEVVITGDSDGQVIVWHNIFQTNPVSSVYHWHTLSVNCLSFSSSGSYFYSGGNENVLVRWNWENSQNKKFLPRMSNHIQQIAVSNDSQLVAVSTSDNCIKIIDSAFNDVSTIQHLIIGDNYESGILLDPRTKCLIMNANAGQIQFYQPNNNTLLYTIDVVGQNQLTNERNFSVENTQVTKFSISRHSFWLATVEGRKVAQYSHQETRLKFWNFNSSQQTYELNTSIEKPHLNIVLAIEFQFSNRNDELKCVTIGGDKKFKVWFMTTIQQNNTNCIVWRCRSVGFYRDLPCKALSFSGDGSLMSIGFGAVITMWSPDTSELKCSLVHPEYKSNIEVIQFGTSTQCHLVVAATKKNLFVWNLLTLTMMWTVPLEVDFLLANKLSLYMVVISKQKEIFIFSPNSPKPLYSDDELLAGKNVMAAAIIPVQTYFEVQSNWYQRIELFLIDSNKEFFSIGVESSDEQVSYNGLHDIMSTTLYSKMIPFSKVTNTTIENRNHLFKDDLSRKNIKKYLEAPVHTMIPIRLTCNSLIKSFIIQKHVEGKNV